MRRQREYQSQIPANGVFALASPLLEICDSKRHSAIGCKFIYKARSAYCICRPVQVSVDPVSGWSCSLTMRSHLFTAFLASGAFAAREFLNEPDTGIDDVLSDLPKGTLPDLSDIIGLPDFDWAARHYLPTKNYTYYRNGAAGEWSYRNNLEVFHRYRLRPRVMVDITKIESTLPLVPSARNNKSFISDSQLIGRLFLVTTSLRPSSSARVLVVAMVIPMQSST